MKRFVGIFLVGIVLMLAMWFSTPRAYAAAPPAWAVLYADHLRTLLTETPRPSAATAAPDASSTPAPTATPAPVKDHYLRCFLRLADLDRNGTPELLYGYCTPDDPEIRVQVLGIVDNRVVKAEGNEVHAAYALRMTKLTLFKTRQGFFWMFRSGGLEEIGGRRQVRYTQLTYRNGKIKSANRFTRRWTSERTEYYTDGETVTPVTYKNRYKVYRSNITAVATVPEAILGNATQIPSPKKILDAFDELVPRYQKIALPEKLKLKGKSAKFQLGARDKARLVISPKYASASALSFCRTIAEISGGE